MLANRVGSPYHARQSAPQVEIFRGLGGYMPGIARLQQRLAERGIASTTSNSSQADEVTRRILEQRKRGGDAPVVLIGYAVGGGGARRTAEKLSAHGLAVDAIALIDPSFFEPAPGNVRACFVAHKPELLQMWNSIMRGNPVKTESDQTVVVHVNLGEHDQAARLKGTTHLAITADAWIQQMLVGQVVEALEVE